MKQILWCLLLFFMPLALFAQTGSAHKGIQWAGLTWEQIKQKAKEESKIIFVDAYTTWCAPCKMMEEHVFSSDTVGEFFKEKIIAVRIQMDTNRNDNNVIKSWYPVAKQINEKFNIQAYPTFLFMSADGVLTQRGEGFMKVPDFLSFAAEAIQPGRVYTNENEVFQKGIQQFRSGVKDYELMPFFIKTAQKRLLFSLRDSIMNVYYNHQLKADKSFLNKKGNIELLGSNLSSSSPFFYLFYPDGKRANEVMRNNNFSRFSVQNLIEYEHVQPFFNSSLTRLTLTEVKEGKEPKWEVLYNEVEKKYNSKYAATAVRSAKHQFYLATGSASLDAKNLKEQLKNNDLDSTDAMTDWLLNSASWNLFLLSKDKQELTEAIEWVKTAVRRRPDMYQYKDTYAGLVYKLNVLFRVGNKAQAIKIQEAAINKAIQKYALESEIKELQDRLDKMKRGQMTWLTVLPSEQSSTEKPSSPIDFSALHHWGSLGSELKLNDNGTYFYYNLFVPSPPFFKAFVQSTQTNWKIELPIVDNSFFSNDNKRFIYLNKDTLHILTLGKTGTKLIPKVATCRKILNRVGPKEDTEWLAYSLHDGMNTLKLLNLNNNREVSFNHVAGYYTCEKSSALVLERTKDSSSYLTLVDLMSNDWKNFFEGKIGSIKNLVIDESGSQVAFCVQTQPDPSALEIWYYKKGMSDAMRRVTNETAGIPEGFSLQSLSNFSKSGRYIYMKLCAPDTRKPNPNNSKINVWNYKDGYLQSYQQMSTDIKTNFAVISTDKISDSVYSLTNKFEDLVSFPSKSDWIIVKKDSSGDGDRAGGSTYIEYYLFSLKNGVRVPLKGLMPNTQFFISPEERYFVYYDRLQSKNLVCYDLATHKTKNIFPLNDASRFIFKDDFLISKTNSARPNNNSLVGIAGWLKDDQGVIMYDNYDLWLLDLKGDKAPVNITKNFGRTHNIKFRVVLQNGVDIFSEKDSLILTAFNTANKFNGFYKVSLKGKSEPELLTMGPYTYYLSYGQTPMYTRDFDIMTPPSKAKNNNVWVVTRQSTNEAPNYYLTADFKSFKKLTDLAPHIGYNWPSAELIFFNQTNGVKTQGILYKPADFDPLKKYPVLINFYKSLSSRLYQFPRPQFTFDANIDVAWFASRGYLVFTPDIYFTEGEMGPSALHSIAGAVNYLSNRSFVDKGKIALCAHSVGGGLAYYIITHSKDFAAAFIGAGTSDPISSLLQINSEGLFGGMGRLKMIERDFSGKSPWDDPNAYISQSPILKADQVVSPILIFHCKKDGALPWEQGIEMYLALRYLGKKAWMLAYDDGTHYVMGKDAEDLTIRATQYFDHYLKNKPAPVWMTQGIPAELKQIETGYALDPAGNCGKNCKVCKMWNEKMRKDSVGTMKEIKEMEGKW